MVNRTRSRSVYSATDCTKPVQRNFCFWTAKSIWRVNAYLNGYLPSTSDGVWFMKIEIFQKRKFSPYKQFNRLTRSLLIFYTQREMWISEEKDRFIFFFRRATEKKEKNTRTRKLNSCLTYLKRGKYNAPNRCCYYFLRFSRWFGEQFYARPFPPSTDNF